MKNVKQNNYSLKQHWLSVILLLTVGSVQASELTIPNSFTSGTKALASEVNANFDATATSVNDNNAQLADILAQLASLNAAVAAQNDVISTLETENSELQTSVEALQVAGAANTVSIASLQVDSSAALADIALLGTESDEQQASIETLQTKDNVLTADIAVLEESVTNLEESTVRELVDYLSIDTDNNGNPIAIFSGINVQVNNGLNETSEVQTVNGLGNLIVGYGKGDGTSNLVCSDGSYGDEDGCEANGEIWAANQTIGSHNIVLGWNNSYTQYGGIVAGVANSITRTYATVTGGRLNVASGTYSSVSSGQQNTASGQHSSVSGGFDNTASGVYSSISGGIENTSSGLWGSVSGGFDNTASGVSSSVSGGSNGEAAGANDWVAGSLFEDQ